MQISRLEVQAPENRNFLEISLFAFNTNELIKEPKNLCSAFKLMQFFDNFLERLSREIR